MTCSYCSAAVKFVFVIQEDVPGLGPTSRLGCFRCISMIGEKIMRPAQADQAQQASGSSCNPCSGCGGIRRENCTNSGRHEHTWCDCQ